MDKISACETRILDGGSELQLFPAGPFRARDGRPRELKEWVINKEIAQRLIDLAVARVTPLLVDYEHQTMRAASNGQPAPKSGAFTGAGLEWREGKGLFATAVEWTKRAKEFIDQGEYSFISPVFRYDSESGEITELLHAALTNDPAIDGMVEVIAATNDYFLIAKKEVGAMGVISDKIKELSGGEESDQGVISQFLGRLDLTLDELVAIVERAEMDEAEVEAKANEVAETLTAKHVEEIATLKSEVAAAKKEAEATSSENDVDPAKYVPVETVVALQSQVAELTSRIDTGESEKLMAEGLADGRILPAMEPWARSLAASNIEELKRFLGSATAIAALSKSQTGGGAPAGSDNGGGLTSEEVGVCSAFNLSEDEFKKAKGEE